MKFRLLTPDKALVDCDNVTAVSAMSSENGSLGILQGHVPLVTPVAISTLSYTQNNQVTSVAIMGGLLTTDGQTVTVLCQSAELSGDIDKARAEAARQRAEARLKTRDDGTDVKRAQLALNRALTRLTAVK